MSAVYVELEEISKRYYRRQSYWSVFRMLKSLAFGKRIREENWVLKGINLKIEKGSKIALFGRNGSGKTTLLRIIAGISLPTFGKLKLQSDPMPLFTLSAGSISDLSVRDNIYLLGAIYGLKRKTIDGLLDGILKRAELEEYGYSPYRDLSMGQKQRLLLSVFFENRHDFLIFDECITYVDMHFMKACDRFFEGIRGNKDITMIMASHDHRFLSKHCTSALWLDKGSVRMAGPIEEVRDAYIADA